ncbi:HEAT repeat domain-containing protein [Saccharibacillus sp. CPCC 101409]|uniref:HEAT repeat domain-containing protein n=1 Tax=Saccharibacillus sp. CPCC 101409 TaxID=3058041 RepID=UPI0026738E72|nr:HEAT repeat domain-containing protein [Saccharibacillus sp. CPCC 101409]MDO3413300.1 HEAT repeat domain-containing protein [Saccharibacillus sp. CPCC 101409]
MAVLIDTFGTSSFGLSFHEGKGLVSGYHDDINNWIPITFETRILEESYAVNPEEHASLNMNEIRGMFTKFRSMMQQYQETNTFRKVEISTYEFYYNLEFEYLKEDEWIACTIWTNQAARTHGKIRGIERGVRMLTAFESFESFVRELEQELLPILSKYDLKLEPRDFQKEHEEFKKWRISSVRKLAENGDSAENAILLKELAETDDPRLRNEIALAVSDLREEKAVDVIVDLVQQRKTLGNRGTLLYALEPLDYARHRNVLLDQVIGGNYETSTQAYTLLEKIAAQFSENEKTAYRRKLEEKIELLRETMSLFD